MRNPTEKEFSIISESATIYQSRILFLAVLSRVVDCSLDHVRFPTDQICKTCSMSQRLSGKCKLGKIKLEVVHYFEPRNDEIG